MRDPGSVVLPLYFNALKATNYEFFGEAASAVPPPPPLRNGFCRRKLETFAHPLPLNARFLNIGRHPFPLPAVPARAFHPVTVACAPDWCAQGIAAVSPKFPKGGNPG
jgi:hypothetical protein